MRAHHPREGVQSVGSCHCSGGFGASVGVTGGACAIGDLGAGGRDQCGRGRRRGVSFNGQRIDHNFGSFHRLKAGEDLVTRSGRAELLLAPGVYLRVGADSGVRMISDELSDIRVELLSGSAIADATELNTPFTIVFGKTLISKASISIEKRGIYRIDADPAQFRVIEGEAEVELAGQNVRLESLQLLPLDGAPVVRRFTDGSDSLLDLWSAERHLLISSKVADAQAITNPLLDPDPDPINFGGLDAYLGYLPPVTAVAPSPAYGLSPGFYGMYGPGAYGAYGIYGGAYGAYGGLNIYRGVGVYPAGIYSGYRPVGVLGGASARPTPGFPAMIRPPAGTSIPFRPGVPLGRPTVHLPTPHAGGHR